MYDLTARVARLGAAGRASGCSTPRWPGGPAEISRFFGALSGAEPLGAYLGPGNLIRVAAGARIRHRAARHAAPLRAQA